MVPSLIGAVTSSIKYLQLFQARLIPYRRLIRNAFGTTLQMPTMQMFRLHLKMALVHHLQIQILLRQENLSFIFSEQLAR